MLDPENEHKVDDLMSGIEDARITKYYFQRM